MSTVATRLTSRRHLDRTLWHTIRCVLALHPMAAWELKQFTLTRKEGRKTIEYTIWANVREAICCGKSEMERVL